MEREATLGVLVRTLAKKPPPEVARARRRAETRDSFLGGSLQQQSERSWSYLKMPMDSRYVERHLYAAVRQRKYVEARNKEKGNSAMYNYKPPLK